MTYAAMPIHATPKVALITGIAGQGGSYFAEFLLYKGYSVHGIKRRASSFNTDLVDHIYQYPHIYDARFKLHYGDLSETSSLVRIVQETQPDGICNLGAQSQVAVPFESPLSSYAVAKMYAYWITVNYREVYGIYACNGIFVNHESPRHVETFVTPKILRGIAKISQGLEVCLYIGNIDTLSDWSCAKDYVGMQWMMLQQEQAEDVVIATGRQHSVRHLLNGQRPSWASSCTGKGKAWMRWGIKTTNLSSGSIYATFGRQRWKPCWGGGRPRPNRNCAGCQNSLPKRCGWKWLHIIGPRPSSMLCLGLMVTALV